MRFAALLVVLFLLLAPPFTRSDEPNYAGHDAEIGFPRGEPAALGIDANAIKLLRERSNDADSDAVIIVKAGRLVADWDFNRDRGPIKPVSASTLFVDDVLNKKLAELNNDLPPLKSIVEGPTRGHAAQGYLGQSLFVMPSHRLVAVRQHGRRTSTNSRKWSPASSPINRSIELLLRGKLRGSTEVRSWLPASASCVRK
jgi:hypothetical protein